MNRTAGELLWGALEAPRFETPERSVPDAHRSERFYPSLPPSLPPSRSRELSGPGRRSWPGAPAFLFAASVLVATGAMGCSETTVVEPEPEGRLSPWEIPAVFQLEGGPWTMDGWCDSGTGLGPELADGGVRINWWDASMGQQRWVACGCPAGFHAIEDEDPIEYDVSTGSFSDLPTCECSNGSPNPYCDPGGGGGGDPGDPGDPGGSGTPIPTDSVGVSLSCDSNVPRGQPGGCELVATSENATFSDTEWKATLPDFELVHQDGDRWDGTIAVWTDVGVTGNVSIPGLTMVAFQLEGAIEVSQRSWDWPSQLDTAQAAPGQFDECFTGPDILGLTVGTDCAAGGAGALFTPSGPLDGHVRLPVSAGPNDSVAFVLSVSTKMELRSQIAKQFRADGDVHPLIGDTTVVNNCGNPGDSLNVHAVNTQCFQEQGFDDFVDHVWDHEGAHMEAAMIEALNPLNDLYMELEGQWRAGFADGKTADQRLLEQVLTIQNDIHSRIFDASKAVDTGSGPSFDFWRFFSPGGWSWHTTQTAH